MNDSFFVLHLLVLEHLRERLISRECSTISIRAVRACSNKGERQKKLWHRRRNKRGWTRRKKQQKWRAEGGEIKRVETERMLRSGSVESVEEGERMKTNNINNLRIFTISSRREER